MRTSFVVPVILAASLASVVALAANDKVSASFESLSASGVTGRAELNPVPAGGTLIHGSVRGLQPSTEYVSRVYGQDQSCGVGTPSELIVRFESNPAGLAQFNKKVAQELTAIRSISIELASDNTVLACAPVTP